MVPAGASGLCLKLLTLVLLMVVDSALAICMRVSRIPKKDEGDFAPESYIITSVVLSVEAVKFCLSATLACLDYGPAGGTKVLCFPGCYAGMKEWTRKWKLRKRLFSPQPPTKTGSAINWPGQRSEGWG